jgi:hypothetical protein
MGKVEMCMRDARLWLAALRAMIVIAQLLPIAMSPAA